MAKVNAYYNDREAAFGGDVFDRGLTYYCASAESAIDSTTAATAKCINAIDGATLTATNAYNVSDFTGYCGDKCNTGITFNGDGVVTKSQLDEIRANLEALQSKIDTFENKGKRRESSLRASLKTLFYAREVN